jgi:tetrahydromethanopterin S-methyltransferase subunit C
MAEKGKKAGLGAGMLSGSAVAALMMLGSLTAFLILALALALPAWAAALIVTGIWAAIAGVLALQGHDRLRAMGKPIPEKTVETVKEDVQWLRSRS